MNEDYEAALMRAGQQIERLQREVEHLRIERDHARIMSGNASRLLTGIHALLYPTPFKTSEGGTVVFRPENPHEFMQTLSDRIRALPDELAKLTP